jgi:hypothetical protein
MSLVLPADVSEASLGRALDELRALVGADHMLRCSNNMRAQGS